MTPMRFPGLRIWRDGGDWGLIGPFPFPLSNSERVGKGRLANDDDGTFRGFRRRFFLCKVLCFGTKVVLVPARLGRSIFRPLCVALYAVRIEGICRDFTDIPGKIRGRGRAGGVKTGLVDKRQLRSSYGAFLFKEE